MFELNRGSAPPADLLVLLHEPLMPLIQLKPLTDTDLEFKIFFYLKICFSVMASSLKSVSGSCCVKHGPYKEVK